MVLARSVWLKLQQYTVERTMTERIILVEYLDHVRCLDLSHQDIEDQRPFRCRVIGYVASESPTHVTIICADQLDRDDKAEDNTMALCLVKSCVIKVTELSTKHSVTEVKNII
jgi:hypothetical protein